MTVAFSKTRAASLIGRSLRVSNTQAVLVARCESDTPAGLDRLKATLAGELRASGVAGPELA